MRVMISANMYKYNSTYILAEIKFIGLIFNIFQLKNTSFFSPFYLHLLDN